MSDSTSPIPQYNKQSELPESTDDSKKRTRVTPSQLSILEETFSISATPDSKMRKQLAYKLQMPERSIQIWFQNRRAKVKMLQKRVLLRQEQEAARARLCAEATSQHGMPYFYSQPYPINHYRQQKLPLHRAWSSDMMIAPNATTMNNQFVPPPPPPPLMSQMFQFDPPSISITGPNELDEDIYSLTVSPSPAPQPFMSRRMESEPLQNTVTAHSGLITVTSITVGSWHRMKISQQDLMCFYKLNERAFSWHIRDSNYHFKMMISFDSIAAIELNVMEDHISAQIDMDLLEPPIFFMENTNSNWVRCSDFTEGMQTSIVLRHHIRGLAVDLRQELLNIASSDERLCQITRFPSVDASSSFIEPTSLSSSIEPAFLMNQNWRHQSVPLASTKEFWVPPN